MSVRDAGTKQGRRGLSPGRLTRAFVVAALALLCISATQGEGVAAADAGPPPAAAKPPPPGAYAGDAACLRCHGEISASYAHTAHHFTSQRPTAASILGSFARGENVLATANPRLIFEMNADADGAFTETAKYFEPSGEVQRLTEPINIVIGSGRKGQTYLWWNSDLLFELPVSYWSGGQAGGQPESHAWINSPGYRDGTAHFDRVIAPQCLECHASYFTSEMPPVNHFAKSSLVLGIGCERCHGPGAEHVRREQMTPQPKLGSVEEAIVNPARLSRQQQIDTCGLCHSGPGVALAPALTFQPGDVLARYIKPPMVVPGQPIDVHTNQVELLRESQCFRSSSMTCTTCHDVHTTQRDLASFAPKCLRCHAVRQCGEFKVMHAAIRTRCVSCHMPLQQSRTLIFQNAAGRLDVSVRTHRIAIYPVEAQAAQ